MKIDADVLFKLVELLLIPFAYYVIKRLDTVAEKVNDTHGTTQELKTILIGADGKNGIRSRVVRLERKVSNLSLQQAARHGETTHLMEPEDEE